MKVARYHIVETDLALVGMEWGWKVGVFHDRFRWVPKRGEQ